MTGTKYTVAADIYSYGMMMYEIATQRLPFEDIKVHLRSIAHFSRGRCEWKLFMAELSMFCKLK